MVEDKLLIDDMSMSDLLKDVPEGVRVGTVVSARVLGPNVEGVLVDIGLKMEGLIPRQEFTNFEKLPFATGDTIPVLVRHVEQVEGYTRVSWRPARFPVSSWPNAGLPSASKVAGVAASV